MCILMTTPVSASDGAFQGVDRSKQLLVTLFSEVGCEVVNEIDDLLRTQHTKHPR